MHRMELTHLRSPHSPHAAIDCRAINQWMVASKNHETVCNIGGQKTANATCPIKLELRTRLHSPPPHPRPPLSRFPPPRNPFQVLQDLRGPQRTRPPPCLPQH